MDREFYKLKAFKDAVRDCKRLRRPLSIWPGEEKLVTIEDLPMIPMIDVQLMMGSPETLPKRGFLVLTDAELQDEVRLGGRYAKAETVEPTMGMWRVWEWS